ncbi:MAG: class I SAM-dependent methyltransferase, partial [Thermoanaerobaculia bacterium]|nr:class I SAM-dependent methyltransferase [Thermoanaerobaculia bacterium]
MSERETTEQDTSSAGSRDEYMMGSSESETRRLVRQSGFYGAFTWRMLRMALEPGMRVLDIGTGAGDVALLAAELVGPEGTVVGIDQNPEGLETARGRAGEAGLTNAEFLQTDLESL